MQGKNISTHLTDESEPAKAKILKKIISNLAEKSKLFRVLRVPVRKHGGFLLSNKFEKTLNAKDVKEF